MKINYKGFMREMIQRNPVTISPDASFSEARSIIYKRGIRHIPVVDDNHKIVGIVTEADIRKAAPSDATSLSIFELEYLLNNLKVSAFMTPKDKLITITPDTLIEEAAQLMRDHKIGCLPVLEGEYLYGIFTETDALDNFVDIFGLKEKGTRLTVAIEDKVGTMLKCGVNVKIWCQATETRYFLFLPSINLSLMRFNAFANDLSLCN